MKNTASFVMALLFSLNSFSQLYIYTNATTGAPATVAANAIGNSLVRVNGATAPGSPCATGFSSANFSAAATYASTLPAISAQVSPAAGYKLSVTDFSVGLRRSGTGPGSVRLAYSIDGGTTWVDKGVNDAPNNGSCNAVTTVTWDPADFDVINNSSGVIFRIFGFGATSMAGTFQVLNLTINGSVTTACAVPTNQPTSLILTPSLTSVSGLFTGAVPGATPATAYLVLISTVATTPQPAVGAVYAIDDVIGNARVVSISAATSFTAGNLTPGTLYYFFVFSNNDASDCYNSVSPLTGSQATTAPPACTAPSVQATGLAATNITGSSMDISYTRGNGDNILVLAHAGSAVNDGPVNSVNYPIGTQIGSGNFVVYNGPAVSFHYAGLTQNTVYYFSLYEYNNTDFCYSAGPLAGSFSTACTGAVNVTSLSGIAGNAQAVLTWVNPTAGCFDEIEVVASTADITGAGGDYSGAGNAAYAGGTQVVYRGTGTGVTVTGLANGTTYFFKVFTRNGAAYSTGVQITVSPYDAASGFLYLFGNLHSHSSYSDGNKDNTSKIPLDDFKFARDANCMDFLGISEHNHSQAGMNIANFPLGYNQADQVNGVVSPAGNSIVTLYGMEWGVISGGGHVIVYGFNDKLIGWETGNYDIYCAKNDYASLWNIVNARPNAFATLAHPASADYGNIASAYNTTADNAIYSVAVESGPAFSVSTSYNDYPSSLAYVNYYKTLLARGYHLGAQMDQDNHNLTFGTANGNRLVVLATAKTRSGVMDAMRAMRFYASEDCNARVDFKAGSTVMGGSKVQFGVPTLTFSVSDPDAGEAVNAIEVWGGAVGGSVPSSPLKTYSGAAAITFNNTNPENNQPNNTTWYYYTITTQADGNRIVSSPIWYSRSDVVLPVTLVNFTGTYQSDKTSLLAWTTAQELNSKSFGVERSVDGGRNFVLIGSVNAKGSAATLSQYLFTDPSPVTGTNLYRLKEIDRDDKFTYSNVISIVVNTRGENYYSLYPNPAHTFTYVNSTSPQARNISVALSDAAGKVIRTAQGPIDKSHPFKINLEGVNAGIYFIKIVSENTISTTRVMVK